MLTTNQELIGNVRKCRSRLEEVLPQVKDECAKVFLAPENLYNIDNGILQEARQLSYSAYKAVNDLIDEFKNFDELVDKIDHYKEEPCDRLLEQKDLVKTAIVDMREKLSKFQSFAKEHGLKVVPMVTF